MYAISRLEPKPGIWCWAVNFRRRGKGYCRHFHDLKLGGVRKALAAALAWRDRQLSRLRTLSKREFCRIVRSSNRSGVPGVYFLRPKGHRHGVWQAQVRLRSGEKLTKTFSVHKYGQGPAFEQAVRARRGLLRFVEDRPYLGHATAKALAKKREARRRRERP